MEVLSPSHFTLLCTQYNDFEAPLYDGDYVNGAVVPFSWEEKPGVPLMMSLENIKEKELACAYREAGVMLNPNYIDNSKEKEVCMQNYLQVCPNQLLFPLPKPPSACLQYISSPNNSTYLKNSNYHVSKNSSSTFLSPHSLSYSTSKTHTPKQRRSPLHAYLNNKQAKNTTIFMNKANLMKDDPFLKAIEACTEPCMEGPHQVGTNYERIKVEESPTKEAEDDKVSNSKGFSLSKLFEDKMLGAKSKQFDDKVLNSKASLIKLNGAFEDRMLFNTKSPLIKLNGPIDNKVLINNKYPLSKSPLRKLNEAYEDKVLNNKSTLRKLNEDKVLNYIKSPLSKLTPLSKLNEALDDKVVNIKSPLSKLNEDEKEVNAKSQLSKYFDDKVISSKPQLRKINYEAAFEQYKLPAAYYRSPIRKSYGGIMDMDKEVVHAAAACRTPVRKIMIESGKKIRYDGHPAFMAASFHQSPKAAQKKPITHIKPAQARRPLHQRSSSYGSYGCLGCSSADHSDSIVRL